MHAVETVETPSKRGPDVSISPTSRKGKSLVHNEVGFIPVGLGEVPSGLLDISDRPTRCLLQRNIVRFLFLYFAPSLGKFLAELWITPSI